MWKTQEAPLKFARDARQGRGIIHNRHRRRSFVVIPRDKGGAVIFLPSLACLVYNTRRAAACLLPHPALYIYIDPLTVLLHIYTSCGPR